MPVVPAPMAAAPRFGLLASLSERTNDVRWFDGKSPLEYAPEGCQEGTTVDPCDFATNLDPASAPATSSWMGYGITVAERCTTFGGVEDRLARAERLLNSDTERQLGAEFWSGTLASVSNQPDGNPWPNTWLANVADVDILTESGPVALTHGLACLENYLASNNGGQQGAIHATAQVATHWNSLGLLRRDGERLLTLLDTVVIVSPGYAGTDPDGNIGENNVWAYATDLPRVWLGPVQRSEVEASIDRRNNEIVLVAQRPGLVEFQRCRHGGVKLAVVPCDQGGS